MDINIVHADQDKKSLHSLAGGLIIDKVFDSQGSMIVTLLDCYDMTSKRRRNGLTIVAAEVYDEQQEREIYVGAIHFFHHKKEIHIYVKPEYRKRGIAKKLIDELRDVYNLKRTVLFSWGAMDDAGVKFFEQNFVHVYIQVFPGDIKDLLTKCQEAGFKDDLLRYFNDEPIRALRKKLRDSTKIH